MGEKEGKVTGERKHSKKRIAAVLIVIILLQVIFIAVWYEYYRPWTIRDVAEATDIDLEGEKENFFTAHGHSVNPSFSHDLVGQEKTVKGHVTDVSTYMTPIGPLTYYELDYFEVIHIIEWNMPRYKVGSEIEKKVSFEWGRWNEDRIVCSPQLDFPVVGGGILIERHINRVSRNQAGMILLANQTVTDGGITISVALPKGEGFPLALFNCSLRRGRFGSGSDYSDSCRHYRENPIVDSISSLTNVSGANNTIHFSDANQNGLLDDGDYFTFNVARPKDDCDLLTYLFSINHLGWGYKESVLSGECFIVMTNRGLLTRLSCLTDKYNKPPYLIMRVLSEEERPVGVTTRIIIERVINDPPLITDSICGFYTPSIELSDGEMYHQGGRRIIFSDVNANGLVDAGDIFTITGFANRTEYEFHSRWVVREGDNIVQGGYCSSLKWTTGIGTDTGYLPVIQFREQNITGTDQKTTYMIEIERMYGVPGLNLAEDFYRWFQIHIEREGQEILSATNLTLDFNVTSDEFNLTFLDVDANEFINSGDSFHFEGNPGTYSMTLDYVSRDPEVEEGFRNLLSQSFSWTI